MQYRRKTQSILNVAFFQAEMLLHISFNVGYLTCVRRSPILLKHNCFEDSRQQSGRKWLGLMWRKMKATLSID